MLLNPVTFLSLTSGATSAVLTRGITLGERQTAATLPAAAIYLMSMIESASFARSHIGPCPLG